MNKISEENIICIKDTGRIGWERNRGNLVNNKMKNIRPSMDLGTHQIERTLEMEDGEPSTVMCWVRLEDSSWTKRQHEQEWDKTASKQEDSDEVGEEQSLRPIVWEWWRRLLGIIKEFFHSSEKPKIWQTDYKYLINGRIW